MATKKTKEAETEEVKAEVEETKKTKEAETEEVKAEVEETKKTLTEEDPEYWDELVPFKAIYDGDKYSADIRVGVNDKFWVIKRGVEVMIPRKVLSVIENSEAQKQKAAMERDAYIANMNARAKEM